MQPTRQWTILARVLRPQGRKGEVLAELFTDFPDRFAQHPHVQLAPTGFTDAESPGAGGVLQPVEITSYWLPTGRNAGRVVLHFAGTDSITQAEALAGKEVVVPLEERMPLDDGAVYISDLADCAIYDDDILLGTVEDVEFPATPDGARRLEDAAPLLVVHGNDGDELLVPFAKDYLVKIDLAAKIIRMKLPEGLADLNRGAGPTKSTED
jgi:16S rRNA processing protein RimM